jgi:hypothetical protein
MTEALFYEVVKHISIVDDDATPDDENLKSDR